MTDANMNTTPPESNITTVTEKTRPEHIPVEATTADYNFVAGDIIALYDPCVSDQKRATWKILHVGTEGWFVKSVTTGREAAAFPGVGPDRWWEKIEPPKRLHFFLPTISEDKEVDLILHPDGTVTWEPVS